MKRSRLFIQLGAHRRLVPPSASTANLLHTRIRALSILRISTNIDRIEASLVSLKNGCSLCFKQWVGENSIGQALVTNANIASIRSIFVETKTKPISSGRLCYDPKTSNPRDQWPSMPPFIKSQSFGIKSQSGEIPPCRKSRAGNFHPLYLNRCL